MSKYIDADELKKQVMKEIEEAEEMMSISTTFAVVEGAKRVLHLLEQMPSADVVEVVRCKDCKWWGVYDEPIKHCRIGMLRLPVREYEFCYKGERKKQNDSN